jgi:SpoVK/Ycf46/Vps4 family AAA+-type ATPase
LRCSWRRCRPAPAFGVDFPAQRVRPAWNGATSCCPPRPWTSSRKSRDWLESTATSCWRLGHGQPLRPGYTCLFHGPPGTGKTLVGLPARQAAAARGLSHRPVLIVSKYIGETEKNLARVFDIAEPAAGSCSSTRPTPCSASAPASTDAHDRYANQEVSYLLQRIEEFPGVVILASNLKPTSTTPSCAASRPSSQFPCRGRPSAAPVAGGAARKAELDARVDLEQLSERFEITGGAIVNVVRHAALQAVSRRSQTILLADLEEGVRRELLKAGRIA